MRLAFVSHSLPPENRPLANVGGMQRVAAELSTSLKRTENLSLHVIEMRVSWTWINVRIIPFLLATYLKLFRLVRSEQIDSILFSSMVTGLLILPLNRVLRRRSVRTNIIVHGLDVTSPFGPYQWLIRRVFQSADSFLPVSRATGDVCVDRGLDPGKIHVVHNGIDTDRFLPPDTREKRRSALIEAFGERTQTLSNETIILCSVGRHVQRKGFVWFVTEVMPLLPDHVHYWLAGHGPEYSAISAAVTRLDLEHRVCLLGMLSDTELAALYPGADLFIMPNIPVPNDMEGFGIVMLEAGLNGTPSVASNIEGIREVIRNGENGILVRSQDAGAFADAISSYIDDSEYMAQARTSARSYTKNTFGWDTITNRYVEACTPQNP
ncbi:MAG: glycosyltransferase family 4 protein [Bacteroidetes bacterium]|nr:glycosyltransferase family 4 protein [Bacteroidota bacterium]